MSNYNSGVNNRRKRAQERLLNQLEENKGVLEAYNLTFKDEIKNKVNVETHKYLIENRQSNIARISKELAVLKQRIK